MNRITEAEFLARYNRLCEETGWWLEASVAYKVEGTHVICKPQLNAAEIPSWNPGSRKLVKGRMLALNDLLLRDHGKIEASKAKPEESA